MKLFKTVFAATAIAAMLSSCTDVADATPETLKEEGIKKLSASVYNGYGKLNSGLDVVNGTLVKGVVVGEVSKKDSVVGNITLKWGDLAYTKADTALVDFKTINSANAATTLKGELKSLNGTKYAAITTAEFDEVTKNVKKFKERLLVKADAANQTTLTYTKEAPYFVAKLGNSRGYALVNVSFFQGDFKDAATGDSNLGKATLDYYFVSTADATK